MKELVLQRIIRLLKERSNSENQFAKLIGANQRTINQQLKKERSLSLDTVLSVLSSFEDISAEWLLRGEGEMYKADDKNINDNFDKSQYVSIKKYESIVNLFGQTASELKDMAIENKMLYDEIRKLKEQLVSAKSA